MQTNGIQRAPAEQQAAHYAASGWLTGSRDAALAALQNQTTNFDLLIIGGGITGAGILREATRRGLKALLVERRDFAWGTSSRSSKMVHGGLRYLGSGQYHLTRDSVTERQRLLQEAPGLVDPLHFMMPHYRHAFPGAGLFGILLTIYDWIAGKRNHDYYPQLKSLRWVPGLRTAQLTGATRFADAVTDDARLVQRLLHESVRAGGLAINYLAAGELLREQGRVVGATLQDQQRDQLFNVRARVVINATGAWTDQLRQQLGAARAIRPLRGSHLVFPYWRLPVACSVSLFHPQDRRPVFVFPWEGVTVVGTTDLDHQASLGEEASISQQEADYLLQVANQAFPGAALTAKDVQCSWSGVRPVVSSNGPEGKLDPSKEKREHVIWDDAGLISVAGGKLTTFRLIALDVLKSAAAYLPELALPQGGATQAEAAIFSSLQNACQPARLSGQQWRRLRGHYGDDASAILEVLADTSAVGATDTLWAEVAWCARHEAIVHLDDLLLRRTRLGLLLPNGGLGDMATLQALCQDALGWSDSQWQAEVARYQQLWKTHYALPVSPTGPMDEVSA